MLKVNRRVRKVVWATSLSLGAVIMVAAVLTLQETSLLDDYVFFTLVATLVPPAVLEYTEYRWKKAVDEHLPDLFRSIVQAQQAGLTLPQALEEASKRNYGPLTAELKKIINQMSWSMTFGEAFQKFGERVDTSLVRRTVPLVIEAGRSGGHVEEVFSPMGEFIQSMLTMEKERKAQTRPYIAIIYVAFYVFVFTVILLFKTFFVEIGSSPVIGLSSLSSAEAWRIFFHMSSLQAVFGGLVAGKMGENTVRSGLKHSVILLASGYIALKTIAW